MKAYAPKRTELIHHINRLEGQLAAVKRELDGPQPDCVKASNALCAASRSFASLRQRFLSCFLEEQKFSGTPQSEKARAAYEALLRVVSS